MLLQLLAIAALSQTFQLPNAGPRVEVQWNKSAIASGDVNRSAFSIAQTVWKDFCGETNKREKCAEPASYLITVALLDSRFRFCDVTVGLTSRSQTDVRTWAHYTCHSREGDKSYHVFRDNSDIPQFGSTPQEVGK